MGVQTVQTDDGLDLGLFKFSRVLNEDPHSKTINLLGTYPSSSSHDETPAILILTKTHFDAASIESYVRDEIGSVKVLGVNDIYNWLLGWVRDVPSTESTPARAADVKLTLIRNATEVHVRKYSQQKMLMVHETPQLYREVVLPWVEAIPPERIQWVHNLLAGKTSESILSSTPTHVLVPDLKWDQTSLSSLYLVAIARDHQIRSIRDLKKVHVGLLKDIRRDAYRVVHEKWGLTAGQLRMYFHYPPSYYHLHVHVTALTYSTGGGMTVGQAHLLDDVISLLELDSEEGLSLFEKRTLTYGLGEQHGLYDGMIARQEGLMD